MKDSRNGVLFFVFFVFQFAIKSATRWIAMASLVGIVFWNFSAGADEKKSKDRRQTISFEDELVEGTTQKPDLFYLLQKKNYSFSRMVKLRKDFVSEMKRSLEDIRGRSDR